MNCAQSRRAKSNSRVRRDNKLIELYDSNDAGGIDRATAWPIIDGHLLQERVFETFRARRTERRAAVDRRHRGRRLDPAADPHARRAQAPRRRGIWRHGRGFLEAISRQIRTPKRNRPSRRIDRHQGVQLGELDLGQYAAQDRRARGVYFYHFNHAPPKPIIGDRGDLSRDIGVFHTGRNSLRVPDARCPLLAVAGRGPRAVRHDGRATGRTSPPREIRMVRACRPGRASIRNSRPPCISATASTSGPCPTWRRSNSGQPSTGRLRRTPRRDRRDQQPIKAPTACEERPDAKDRAH